MGAHLYLELSSPQDTSFATISTVRSLKKQYSKLGVEALRKHLRWYEEHYGLKSTEKDYTSFNRTQLYQLLIGVVQTFEDKFGVSSGDAQSTSAVS